MAESHDLRLGRELLLQPIFGAIGRFDFFEHLHRLFVRAAVQRPLQCAAGRSDCGINSSQGRSRDARGERGRIEFVIGVQIENRVQHSRLPVFGNFPLQLVKEVSDLAQLWFFRQWFFILRNSVTIGDQC